MLVLITGGPGTANAWMCQAVCQAFALANATPMDVDKVNDLLNENNFLKEHNLSVGKSGLSICECRQQQLIVQLTPPAGHNSPTIMATSAYFIPLPIQELKRQADHRSFIVGTHAPMGDFIHSDLLDSIHAIIFTHRNPIDEMAS
ncbi:MAG TPA: hypothetical protein ENK33_01090, partial [Desulfobacterales bacterium]|nr:hypothetical protein [Desulfobacterales bacterium]